MIDAEVGARPNCQIGVLMKIHVAMRVRWHVLWTDQVDRSRGIMRAPRMTTDYTASKLQPTWLQRQMWPPRARFGTTTRTSRNRKISHPQHVSLDVSHLEARCASQPSAHSIPPAMVTTAACQRHGAAGAALVLKTALDVCEHKIYACLLRVPLTHAS